jgi:hypothetical protein
MPKKLPKPSAALSDRWFAKELKGETPPSFTTMEKLYGLACDLYGLHPWRLLNESQLILVRDSISGETCYCSVMGALGEVYSVHVYIGTESFRLYRRMEAEEITDPGEFFASQRGVSVEFVPKTELEQPDRELLSAMKHPQGRGVASPIFRAIRPGFLPWFVTEAEAQTLTECLRAVIAVCSSVVSQKSASYWKRKDTYPIVSCIEGNGRQFKVDLVKAILPAEPPVAPVQLDDETLRQLRSQDYSVQGVMELDHILSGATIGKKSERPSFAAIALALDAKTGIVYAPEITDSSVAIGEVLARVFLKTVQDNRTLPKEVRVRSQKLKDSLAPLMEAFDVSVRVVSQLPAADEARAGLLGFLQAGFGDR